MNYFFIGIITLFLSGIISNLFSPKFKIKSLIVFTGIASLLTIIPTFLVFFQNSALTKTLLFNPIFGHVNFTIDTLSAFFILIISIMSFLAIIYSNGYLKPYIEKGKDITSHIIFLPILVATMLLVVVCQNALLFLIFWELMSLSSFFLVIFENEDKNVLKAGIKYLVFMHVSVLFIIVAFALGYINSHCLDFNAISKVLQNNITLANVIFMFAFLGFGTKAGFVPFHNWLPDAHPAAPSHISGIMSGIMIKTGIYGILRTLLLIGIPSKGISYFVLLIAIISGLYGVLYAITQHDLKRLLAYHSIENIGIIGIGIGIGMIGLAYQNSTMAFLGLSGGILHILNHSIFKPLLFLCAGNVYLKTHTRNIEFLGGLIKTMPMTAILFIIGSIAICGLPPFNGFISEFLIYIGIINGLTINKFFTIIMIILALSGLALIGTMAILCFSKATGIIFLGTPKTENSANVKEDVEFSMILPIIVFAIFALLIGLFPQYILIIINKTTSLFIGAQKINFSIITDLMKIISRFSLIFITFVGILVFIKYKIQKSKITAFETWGCGYDKPSSKMQYTASSYAKPFVIVLRPLFKKVFDVVKPKKLFPKEAHYHSHIDDIEEAYFINPLVKFDEHILSKFEKLQDGNIQTYIKYGMGFLIIILIVCLFIS